MLLALIVAGLSLVGCTSNAAGGSPKTSVSSTAAGGSTAATATKAVLEPARVTALETALTSTDPAKVEPNLAPAARAAYHRAPNRLLSPGARIQIQSETLIVNGESASVLATVAGGSSPGQWLLLLTKDEGASDWLIYGTRKP
jgi:hypothetical protein